MSSRIKAEMISFIQSGAPPEAVALMSFRHDYSNSKLEVWNLGFLKFHAFEHLCLSAILVLYRTRILVL